MRTATTLLLTAAVLLLTPALASAKQIAPTPWDTVTAAASALEKAAQDIHRSARADFERGGWDATDALRELAALESASRRFHKEVERHRNDPYRSEAAYRALEWAFFRAARDLHVAHPFGEVERDFRRIGVLMRDLSVRYQRIVLVSYGQESDAEPPLLEASRSRTTTELGDRTSP